MATLVMDPYFEQQIRAHRAESGRDRYDEIWEGTYVMTPAPNLEHQTIVLKLGKILDNLIGETGLGAVFPESNVTDRESDWTQNYREPDLVVVLKDGLAKNCGTHLCGGPDFVVEIISPHDRGREKFDFYAKIGVREFMVIDRSPWSLELYRLHNGGLETAGQSQPDEATLVMSAVLPLSFRLLSDDPRPRIEVTHHDGVQRWII